MRRSCKGTFGEKSPVRRTTYFRRSKTSKTNRSAFPLRLVGRVEVGLHGRDPQRLLSMLVDSSKRNPVLSFGSRFLGVMREDTRPLPLKSRVRATGDDAWERRPSRSGSGRPHVHSCVGSVVPEVPRPPTPGPPRPGGESAFRASGRNLCLQGKTCRDPHL